MVIVRNPSDTTKDHCRICGGPTSVETIGRYNEREVRFCEPCNLVQDAMPLLGYARCSADRREMEGAL